MKKRYIKIALVILISLLFVILYDSYFKDYNSFNYVLADGFFCSSLIILMIGLISMILSFGGFASLRYSRQKKKDKKANKKSVDYGQFVSDLQEKKVPYKDLFIIFFILFMISYLISYI